MGKMVRVITVYEETVWINKDEISTVAESLDIDGASVIVMTNGTRFAVPGKPDNVMMKTIGT